MADKALEASNIGASESQAVDIQIRRIGKSHDKNHGIGGGNDKDIWIWVKTLYPW